MFCCLWWWLDVFRILKSKLLFCQNTWNWIKTWINKISFLFNISDVNMVICHWPSFFLDGFWQVIRAHRMFCFMSTHGTWGQLSCSQTLWCIWFKRQLMNVWVYKGRRVIYCLNLSIKQQSVAGRKLLFCI